MTSSYILGISCYYHDSAASLIKDGEILGASQEERFTRIKHDGQKGSYLGPQYSDTEIETFLNSSQIPFIKLSPEELLEKTCQFLEEKKIIGWFQGKMEFGPRALGHRSILGDARISDLQKTMNLRIKFRESFRPFAPIVLKEDFYEAVDSDNIPGTLSVMRKAKIDDRTIEIVIRKMQTIDSH
jgi:predicted NodU family carbamoyl transferase